MIGEEVHIEKKDLFSDEFSLDDNGVLLIRSLASWVMVAIVTSVLGYGIDLFDMFSDTEEYVAEGFSPTITYGGGSVMGTVIYTLVGLLLNFFLYRFASQSRRALTEIDSEKLINSFRSLRIYFVVTSILMILGLLLILLGMTAILR